MTPWMEIAGSLVDLILVVLGFSAIIVIHEAGHFFAARWAGVRVMAFAVGFGPALLSFRKGLGWRRGSSEPEYMKRAGQSSADGLSSTEYRLNMLPFGGYVKMLGQDDADPSATSSEPDSYQRCKPWKRMVIISAGVVANVIIAAILFVVVFMVGIKTETARIGEVAAKGPAGTAMPLNGTELGVRDRGLKPGDRVLRVGETYPSHFNDVVLATAMAPKNQPIRFVVERPGVKGMLQFDIVPTPESQTGMLSIGIAQMATTTILNPASARNKAQVQRELEFQRLSGIEPGMKLVEVNGKSVNSPFDLQVAAESSGGQRVSAVFAGEGGKRQTIDATPVPELQRQNVELSSRRVVFMDHLLGLVPAMSVDRVEPKSAAENAGLKPGDIFVQIGALEWPSLPAGIREIDSHRNRPLDITVLRQASSDTWQEVKIGKIMVSSDGKLGFWPSNTANSSTRLSAWPTWGVQGTTPSGASLAIPSGTIILAVNGQPVQNLGQVRTAIVQAIQADASKPIELGLKLPIGATGGESIRWSLTPEEVSAAKALSWESPIDTRLFERESFIWKASGVGDAVSMGLHETHRVMMMTYVTFARLFQGSLKIEALKGPVGIAHVGMIIVERGPIWFMFFLALISVNLAVINFLPIPIADGGHMVFLIYEQITGKPPPVRVQNIAAIVGLVLIGSLFIIVTFTDISNAIASIRQFFNS